MGEGPCAGLLLPPLDVSTSIGLGVAVPAVNPDDGECMHATAISSSLPKLESARPGQPPPAEAVVPERKKISFFFILGFFEHWLKNSSPENFKLKIFSLKTHLYDNFSQISEYFYQNANIFWSKTKHFCSKTQEFTQNVREHNSLIFDECQTQSAWVLALP